MGLDPQSILQLGKRGYVDECPYQPREESAHADATGLEDRKILADHGHIAFVEISERMLRLPSLEPLVNEPSHKSPLLDRCLRDVLTMNQHVVGTLRTYEMAGRLLLGLDPLRWLF